tara:strand:- start:152 stop:427 length:276 start_codon:yes stop_codon:yes gene_type:complete
MSNVFAQIAYENIAKEMGTNGITRGDLVYGLEWPIQGTTVYISKEKMVTLIYKTGTSKQDFEDFIQNVKANEGKSIPEKLKDGIPGVYFIK